MKNRRRWLLIIVVLFFLGFIPAYRGELVQLLQETGVYRLTPEAKKAISLQITDLYLGCRHSVSRQREVTAEDLPELLKEMQQNRKINVFTGEALVLNGEFSGLCPVCKEEEFVGVYQGYVAVYSGRPGRPGPVKEMTLLNVQGLPEEEITDLETGIAFSGLEEKLLILEAYSEEYTRNSNRPED